MARTSLTSQDVARTGLVLSGAEPNVDGDVFDCGDVGLYVDNTTAGPVVVTVLATASQDGLEVEDLIVSVPATSRVLIGPFPQRTFGQPSGAVESGGDDHGRAYVNYDVQTGVNRSVVGL